MAENPGSGLVNGAYMHELAEWKRARGIDTAEVNGVRTDNGGMKIERVRVYEEDTLLVRLVSRAKLDKDPDGSAVMASGWWLTQDLFNWLMDRARSSGKSVIDEVRKQLLLPKAWSDADCFVRAYPRKPFRLGAWFGWPRDVAVPGTLYTASKDRLTSSLYQLYIPGLGADNGANVRAWLVFEGAYDMTLQRGQILAPGVEAYPFHPVIRRGTPHRP